MASKARELADNYSNSQVGILTGVRNIIINGDMRINQRIFDGDWSLLADGDYGYDRWKKLGTDIQQVVEEGNYKPNTVYTLSGTNVVTAQLTSPASGHWTITVPNTATNVQLEEGSLATPFELRSVGVELTLCQRYYEARNGRWHCDQLYDNRGSSTLTTSIDFNAPKRAVPSISGVTFNSGTFFGSVAFMSMVTFETTNSITNIGVFCTYFIADAEL